MNTGLRLLRAVAFAGTSLLAGSAVAQIPSLVDPAFDPRGGANNDVFALALQPDGKILIAGQFTTFDGTNRGRIARLNPDGSLDLSFNPGTGANGDVYAVAVQSDGRVLLGGGFTIVNGVTSQYLARLHTNGAVDTAFAAAVGTDINHELRCLALQPDGRILIGGRFTQVAGQNRGRIARLHADGTLDTAFATGAGADNNVRCLVLQADGKTLIGGTFTTYNGVARNRVARLTDTGSLDTAFDPGAGADDQVRAIAVATNGFIYIGGDFEVYNSTNKSAVARLFPNGGLDLSFDQGNPANDTVRAIALQADGQVWIGGQFGSAGGLPCANLARLNPDGSADASVPLSPGTDDEVFGLQAQSDGLFLMSGKFRSVNGVTRHHVARLIPPEIPALIRLGAPLPASGPEGGEIVFTIERIGLADGEASVNYATSNGTAIGGADFTPVLGTLTFAPGETHMTITVPLLPDLVYDPEEDFHLVLSAPQGAALGVPASWSARIAEISPAIEFLYAAFSEVEGRTSYVNDRSLACVMLRRTGYIWPQPWSVDYEIIPGTAQPGVDFSGPLHGTVDFTIGNDFRFILIPLLNDGVAEPPETLTIRLVSATGAVLTTNNVATLTILDDDGPVEWEAADWKAGEGTGMAQVRVRRNDNGPLPLSVDYTTGDGTATGGEDFVPVSGSLTFQPGEQVKTVSILLLDDCRIEADEWLTLTLSNAQGEAALGTNTTVRLTILDDERPGSFDPLFDTTGWMPPRWAYPGTAHAAHLQGGILIGTGETGGGILRVRRDGSLDPDFVATNFIPPLPPLFAGMLLRSRVEGLLVLPGGDILVLAKNEGFFPDGSFLTNHLIRLKADGRVGSSFLRDPRIILGQRESPFASTIIGDRVIYALQPSGKILVNGWTMTPPAATGSDNLARLNADGSLDLDFRSGATNVGLTITLASALAVSREWRILVSGTFSGYGTNFGGVMRLLPDGAQDTTFAPAMFQLISPFGFTFDSPPTALAVQSDGAILAAGEFNRVNGASRGGLARLRPDGTLDEAFHPADGLPASAAPTVATLLLDERGRILISGSLARALGGPNYPVARLRPDGSLDVTFQMNENDLQYWPTQLLLTDDSKILAVGPSFGLYRLQGDAYPRLKLERQSSSADWRLASPAISGDTYLLQATTDFLRWDTIESRTASGCSIEFLATAAGPHRFFRLERRAVE